MIGALGAVNAGIVFYNIGSATGAILNVWSGLHTTGMSAASRFPHLSPVNSPSALLSGFARIMLGLSWASLHGLTPAFVLPGGGFAAVRVKAIMQPLLQTRLVEDVAEDRLCPQFPCIFVSRRKAVKGGPYQ